jgi:hypothetical protein
VSQEEVDLVRKAFVAFKSGGMEAVLPFYAPDVVCYPVSEWLEDPAGQIKDSGVPIRQAFGVVYSDFRDGMTGEVRYFTSLPQALEAVGLSE